MAELTVTCGLCPGTFSMGTENPEAVAGLLAVWQKGHTHEPSGEDRTWDLVTKFADDLVEGVRRMSL